MIRYDKMISIHRCQISRLVWKLLRVSAWHFLEHIEWPTMPCKCTHMQPMAVWNWMLILKPVTYMEIGDHSKSNKSRSNCHVVLVDESFGLWPLATKVQYSLMALLYFFPKCFAFWISISIVMRISWQWRCCFSLDWLCRVPWTPLIWVRRQDMARDGR